MTQHCYLYKEQEATEWNPQCITAIREGSNATGKTPDRNGGADVINLDVSHFGKTACRLFRKKHRKRN